MGAIPVGELPMGDPPTGRLASGKLLEPAIPQRQKVTRATLAQNGHSPMEQAIYDLLWRYGAPETEDSKLLTIGYAKLAEALRRDRTNIRDNVHSLMDKYAIEVVTEGGARISSTYRVLSYRKIMEKRRSHGLEWVQKRGTGVLFVQPPRRLPIGELPIGEELFATGSPMGDTPVGDSQPPMGELPTLFIEKNEALEINRPAAETAAPSEVVRAFHDALGHCDDDLANRTVAACRQVEPTATAGEVAHFIRQVAPFVLRDGAVKNAPAVMPARVSRCFAGETFRQYRGAAARDRERKELEKRLLADEAKAVLEDPKCTDADREWAHMILGEGKS
jgi:hypothetical protein